MSDKPLSQRLRIKSGTTLALLKPPADYREKLSAGIEIADVDSADIVQLFIRSKAELKRQLPTIARQAKPGAIIWVTYPKLTSAMVGDLNRDVIREYAPSIGLTTVAQIAVDQDWSALRLKRVEHE